MEIFLLEEGILMEGFLAFCQPRWDSFIIIYGYLIEIKLILISGSKKINFGFHYFFLK